MKNKTKRIFLIVVLLILIATLSPTSFAFADENPNVNVISPYYTEIYSTLSDGTPIVHSIINGPSKPLPEYEQEMIDSYRDADGIQGLIPNFPSYSWVFGCSAVSQAMISAYQDQNGYPNLYTGPTNGGVAPITDTSWPRWSDNYGDQYPSNPLIASRVGTDGRTIKGSIEDYWVKVDSTAADPYITGGWPQHSFAEAAGDYMRTSQSAFGNVDGATGFYTYDTNPAPLTCQTLENEGVNNDGTVGRKAFYQSRGYTVTECYNQKTDNTINGGFSLAQFKQEIDAGRPVFINLAGHSIVGYGYEGNTIYIRDTWNSDPNVRPTMPWGGSYQGMQMLSVSIVKLSGGGTPPSGMNLALPMILKPAAPPPPTQPIKNGDFELGKAHWAEYSSGGYELIQIPPADKPQPTSGRYLAWLGGAYNETSRLSQSFTVPANLTKLMFNFWAASQDACGYDKLRIRASGTVVGYLDLCKDKNTNGWVTGYLSLAGYANQTITLEFEVTTDDSLNSNFFMDDVRMAADTAKNDPDLPQIMPTGDIYQMKQK
jgi:hypothetical protein